MPKSNLEKYNIISLVNKSSISQVYKIEEKSTDHIFIEIIYNFDERIIFFNLFYPTIIKLQGISQTDFNQEYHLVFITEFITDLTLNQLIQNEKAGKQQVNWNFTKKLINIYSITSSISYLHSKNIIHLNLNLEKTFETAQLYPKLLYLHLSQINDLLSSDIYSFAMIVYSIIAGGIPFENEFNQKNLF